MCFLLSTGFGFIFHVYATTNYNLLYLTFGAHCVCSLRLKKKKYILYFTTRQQRQRERHQIS